MSPAPVEIEIEAIAGHAVVSYMIGSDPLEPKANIKFTSRALARRFAITYGDLPCENLRFSSAHFVTVAPRAPLLGHRLRRLASLGGYPC